MLKKISIEQFVIIDQLEIELEAGLTILTGETGAGKSIILGALGLVLGGEANLKYIRQGSEYSTFNAIFAPPKSHPVWDFMIKNDLAVSSDEEFIVDRTIKTDGGDDIKFNGKPVKRELLEEVGDLILEIHGQMANQSLLDADNQLRLLDLSGDFPPDVFSNVAQALNDVQRNETGLEEEKKFLATHKKLAKSINATVGKFEKMGMKEGFLEEVQEEYALLLTAKETSEAFQSILARLISANGVVGSLSAANNTLAAQDNLDQEKVVELTEHLASSLKNARDAVAEMNRIAPDYDIDTEPLHKCKEILGILKEIAAQDKVPFEKIYEHFVDYSAKLARIKNGREAMDGMQRALKRAKADYIEHAQVLTEKRIIAGEALSKAITAEFKPLKLEKAEFEVVVEENPNAPWTERGLNTVTFTARMNPGTPFSPISNTASGGELARMILGLKVILQRIQKTPTLVFDEIDIGIGGAAAAAVGERIAQLADTTQVLVITHSPQVASRGDQHFHISKKTDGVTTTSKINELTLEQRSHEISRMLAGDDTTDESGAAALSLIEEARSAAEIRRQNL